MTRRRVFFCHPLRHGLSLAVVAALALAAAACGDDNEAESGRLQVVTTLALFADFVREVGGDRVDVASLVPSGADPHTFEPSPSDVKKVAEADIAFANGLALEPAAEKLIQANLKDGAPLVKLAEEAIHLGPAPTDPHLWMDPAMARLYAAVIDQRLARVDIDGAEEYQAGYARFVSAVDDSESYVKDKVAAVPAEDRKIITTHDAFQYLASAYGLEIIAVVAGSPGQEPSPEDVADISRAIEDENVAAVFAEPQIDAEGRILEQAAEDAGVEVCTLYSDSLDDKVKSYIDLMRFNADEIARCLGGQSDG